MVWLDIWSRYSVMVEMVSQSGLGTEHPGQDRSGERSSEPNRLHT